MNELTDYYLRHYPVTGDNLDEDDIVEDAKRLAAEVERLRDIVARLPKTADGVPVTPGVSLWIVQPITGIVEAKNISVIPDAQDIFAQYYSTREAAEKARAERWNRMT